MQTLAKIAQALDVTVGWFLKEKGYELSSEDRDGLREAIDLLERFWRETQPEQRDLEPGNATAVSIGRRPPKRAPRRGKAVPASATDWRESFGDRRDEEEIEIPNQLVKRNATVIFRAEGESMIGEFIADGDLLYVREESDPKRARGRIVVCIVDGTPYVKRLARMTGSRRWFLMSRRTNGRSSGWWSERRARYAEHARNKSPQLRHFRTLAGPDCVRGRTFFNNLPAP